MAKQGKFKMYHNKFYVVQYNNDYCQHLAQSTYFVAKDRGVHEEYGKYEVKDCENHRNYDQNRLCDRPSRVNS